MEQVSSKKVTGALFWKTLERFGVNGVQFVLQIVLARLLTPEHYGILSMMVIFTTLARVFVQRGFSTALVQNKDVTEEDYSSVLWVSLGIAGVLYLILFITSPLIGQFFGVPEIKSYLRVLALMLFPGALNSIQIAKLSRELNFKKIFTGNIVGIVVSGIIGIVCAYLGWGVWALVIYTLLNVLIACITMRFVVNLRIRFVCNMARVRVLFSYGWKILVSSLIETLYQDIRSLAVGKKYSAGDLGYYDRGKQFPQFITSTINTAIQSVMLPVLSKKQDESAEMKKMMRLSISISSYLIIPMMAGLAGVATPLVTVLLGEKWLPCVPYLMIYCFTMAFIPIHTCNLQAINAMGRSDIYLKLEVIKKIYGIAALIIALVFFNSPIAIAMTGMITTFISFFVNAYPNKKYLGYTYTEQIYDILPSLLCSLTMWGIVMAAGMLHLPDILLLLVQIVVGVFVYVALSALLKLKPYCVLCGLLKKHFHRL